MKLIPSLSIIYYLSLADASTLKMETGAIVKSEYFKQRSDIAMRNGNIR